MVFANCGSFSLGVSTCTSGRLDIDLKEIRKVLRKIHIERRKISLPKGEKIRKRF